ncbi:hypothetical protein E0H80_06970 [Acinetobacter sp. ANC 4779]|uniref:hypothetical protein n=1 Tax=Acinetobacter sp. ANC 4779 TaxID=2529848 RepID=UPI00103CE5A7|nr:hypothetical protein [Acinetobacter sp. ANC 4779]TCB51102.1 hypothetical protein E0H80_06970 [Acinetobacter sp. ANC 4779]
MAEQEDKQALMIQLPWTVPQQPNVQTIVLQQPAKTHMELNASTDKTAISSFALSVIIALILGSFATWLAYWYGRRSFDLTRQSFEAVIKQIESSEQSALNLNAKLFEQQLILQNQKDKSEREKNTMDRFRNAALNFIMHAETFASYITFLHSSHQDFKFEEKIEVGSYEHKIFLSILEKIDLLFESRSNLLFSTLEMEISTYDQVDKSIAEIINQTIFVRNNLIRERDTIMAEVKKYKFVIDKTKLILKKILDKEAA